MNHLTVERIVSVLKKHQIKEKDLDILSDGIKELIMYGAVSKPPKNYGEEELAYLREDMSSAKKAIDFLTDLNVALTDDLKSN